MKTSMNHLASIDGLRGIAIALVLWHHAPILFLSADTRPTSGFWGMSAAGWMGVDLFLVISGYLITTILLRTRNQAGQLRIFWSRRALRILPLAYLYMAILGVTVVLGAPWNVIGHFDGWPFYCFYLGNVHIALNGFQAVPVAILWSLAVEEQFYLVWPIVLRLLDPRKMIRICLWIMLLSPLIRAGVADYPSVYVLSFCRADSLAAGAILASLLHAEGHRTATLRWCRRLAIPALLVTLVMLLTPVAPAYLARTSPLFSLIGYSWLAIAFAILVGASIEGAGWARPILTNPILRHIGIRCYGFYLWHCLVGMLVQRFCALHPSVQPGFHGVVLLWVACTTLVVAASWFLVEKPFLSFKRAFPHAARPTCSGPPYALGAKVMPGGFWQSARGTP